jgi:Fe2+ or Zn2+ uptake regulation protein
MRSRGCAEEPHHDHHHAPAFLICTRCGAAVEIDDPAIFAAARRAAARAGFTPATITVEAEGTCAACAAKAVSDSVRAEG